MKYFYSLITLLLVSSSFAKSGDLICKGHKKGPTYVFSFEDSSNIAPGSLISMYLMDPIKRCLLKDSEVNYTVANVSEQNNLSIETESTFVEFNQKLIQTWIKIDHNELTLDHIYNNTHIKEETLCNIFEKKPVTFCKALD